MIMRISRRWSPVLLSSLILASYVGDLRAVEAPSNAQDFLDLTVPHFELKQVTLVQAVKALRPYGLRVGLELRPAPPGEELATFSLSLSNASIRSILDAIASRAGGYSWSEVKRPYPTVMVNIFPADPKLRLDELMNLRVARFEVKGDVDPANAINQIGMRVPELAVLLGGFVGTSSSIKGEEFCLILQDTTLREVLNEIALRKPGLGWIFRPVGDPSAPHGIYYSWNAL